MHSIRYNHRHMKKYVGFVSFLAVFQCCMAMAQETPTLTITAKGAGTVSFSPDGKTLASGGTGAKVNLWDASTGKVLWTYDNDPLVDVDYKKKVVSCLAFSPDGKSLLVGGANNTLNRLKTSTGERIGTMDIGKDIATSVAFSPNGKTLASGLEGGDIILWDVSTWKKLRTLNGESLSTIRSLSFDRASEYLASSSKLSAKIWHVETGQGSEAISGVTSATYSPNGRTFAICTPDDFRVQVGDRESGEEPSSLKGTDPFCFSPSSKIFAFSNLGSVSLWDVSNRRELATIQCDPLLVQSLSFSPNGKVLATVGMTGIVKLWDVTGLLMK